MSTQEDLNRALAEQRRRCKAKMERLEEVYNALVQGGELTPEGREELIALLEEFRQPMRTKETPAYYAKGPAPEPATGQTWEEKYAAEVERRQS